MNSCPTYDGGDGGAVVIQLGLVDLGHRLGDPVRRQLNHLGLLLVHNIFEVLVVLLAKASYCLIGIKSDMKLLQKLDQSDHAIGILSCLSVLTQWVCWIKTETQSLYQQT